MNRKDCQFQICSSTGCPQDFHGEKPKLFAGLAFRCAASFPGPPAQNFQVCLRASSLPRDCADLSPSVSSLFLSSPSLSRARRKKTGGLEHQWLVLELNPHATQQQLPLNNSLKLFISKTLKMKESECDRRAAAQNEPCVLPTAAKCHSSKVVAVRC